MSYVFSVIVPVYQVKDFLPRCLESIHSQKYKNYEVIMVDDGSTDESGEICEHYAGLYENWKVIHQKNSGLAAARNTGLEHASGKYIVFLDSDDYIEKEYLMKAYVVLEEDGFDICSFSSRRIDEEGRFLYEQRFHEMVEVWEGVQTEQERFLIDYFLQYKGGWEACFHVFRREIIERNQIRFDTSLTFAEDLPFTFEYMLYVDRYAKLPDILYNYTKRVGSLTTSFHMKKQVKGVLVKDFEDMYHALKKYDEKYYNDTRTAIIYAAMYRYFTDEYLHYVSMDELRESLRQSQEYELIHRNLCMLRKQKDCLQNLYGWNIGGRLYCLMMFLLDGSHKKYEKRWEKILRENR